MKLEEALRVVKNIISGTAKYPKIAATHNHNVGKIRRLSFTLSGGVALPDGVTTTVTLNAVTPEMVMDGTCYLVFIWSTPATSGNGRFRITVGQSGSGQVSNSTNRLNTTFSVACEGTANEQLLSFVTLTTNLSPSHPFGIQLSGPESLVVVFERLGGAAEDTLSAAATLQAIWIEHPSDG